jgi:hypothetical protein
MSMRQQGVRRLARNPCFGERHPGHLVTVETRAENTADDAFCPHCHLLIERRAGDEWPHEPLRCPHCRLMVGSGRARHTPAAEPGARGSAAGVFAREAKRSGADGPVSEQQVCRAIRHVAEAIGTRPERLLMLDYQERASGDEGLPALAEVFAAFGSWKRARRAAARDGRGAPPAES